MFLLLALIAFALAKDDIFKDADWVDFPTAVSRAKDNKKPIMVLITREWCGACKSLKASLQAEAKQASFHASAKEMNIVHLDQDGQESAHKVFSEDGYFPRVYFFDANGTPYEKSKFPGHNADYPRFFHDADSILKVMAKVTAPAPGKATDSGSKDL